MNQSTQMGNQIKISNPTTYTRKEDGKVMASFACTGSKEALDEFYADQCKETARQGKPNPSKNDDGTPVFRLTFETAYNYGTTNTLTRVVLQNGNGAWVSANNAEIKLVESLLADPTVSDEEKADLKAGEVMKKAMFRSAVAKNTTSRTQAWIAKQPVSDPFSQVKKD